MKGTPGVFAGYTRSGGSGRGSSRLALPIVPEEGVADRGAFLDGPFGFLGFLAIGSPCMPVKFTEPNIKV